MLIVISDLLLASFGYLREILSFYCHLRIFTVIAFPLISKKAPLFTKIRRTIQIFFPTFQIILNFGKYNVIFFPYFKIFSDLGKFFLIHTANMLIFLTSQKGNDTQLFPYEKQQGYSFLIQFIFNNSNRLKINFCVIDNSKLKF